MSFIPDEENDRIEVSNGIKNDMRTFIDYIEKSPINTKSLAKHMGAGELSQEELIIRLKKVFNL